MLNGTCFFAVRNIPCLGRAVACQKLDIIKIIIVNEDGAPDLAFLQVVSTLSLCSGTVDNVITFLFHLFKFHYSLGC